MGREKKNKKNEVRIDPKEFLSPERLDIVPKVLYIKNREEKINAPFFDEMYSEHIKAFNDFNEDDKKSKEDFKNSFDNVIDSVKKNGFDKRKGLVPMTKNRVAGHGAHRIASAIYFNQPVFAEINEEGKDVSYDYSFFKKRGLSEKFLDEIAFQYSKLKGKNLYFCIFWGTSFNKINDSEIKDFLKKKNMKIVYGKQAELTEVGKKNTVIACYEGEKWLGSAKKGHPGAMNKASYCFWGSNKVKVFLLESENSKKVVEFKEDIRNYLGLDKHALHISDTQEESDRLCELFFNKNSLFFINNSEKAFSKDMGFKKDVRNKENLAITSSFVMDLFGIRESKDVDYISFKNGNVEGIEDHNKYFSKERLKELIYDPENYFVFNGLKFLTLENISKFKEKRGESKDVRDVKLISSFLSKNKKSFDLKDEIIKLKFKLIHLMIRIMKMFPEKPKEVLKKNKRLRSFVRKLFH